MTTLADLTSDVYALTNRPDLVSETLIAIRNATLKMHRTDFYFKDIFETGIQFSSIDYLQTLEYKTLIPNWRSLKYLRKYDAVGQCPGDFLTVITTEQALDSYGITRSNTVYAAGLNLQIRSNTADNYYLLGCYVYPDVTPTGYSSWIADEQSFAIVAEACRVLFKTIGYDEQTSAYEKLVADEITMLRMSNITADGS